METIIPPIVLDACVLVPASLRDLLLRVGREKLYHPIFSDDILIELERALVRRGMATPVQATRLIATLRGQFAGSLTRRSSSEHLIPVMMNDPKDRHVLAAAFSARATAIGTFNLNDFTASALAPHQIAVQSPDSFLANLWNSNAPLLLDIVRQQSAGLTRPPLSVDQVLDNLALHAPAFAALAREALHAAD